MLENGQRTTPRSNRPVSTVAPSHSHATARQAVQRLDHPLCLKVAAFCWRPAARRRCSACDLLPHFEFCVDPVPKWTRFAMHSRKRLPHQHRGTGCPQRVAGAARAQTPSRRRQVQQSRPVLKRHLASTRVVQSLLRWPSKSRIQDALAETGKQLEKASSGIIERGQQDIARVRSAPLSEYSEVWTFPICLITYSTMVIAWASELAGALRSTALPEVRGNTRRLADRQPCHLCAHTRACDIAAPRPRDSCLLQRTGTCGVGGRAASGTIAPEHRTLPQFILRHSPRRAGAVEPHSRFAGASHARSARRLRVPLVALRLGRILPGRRFCARTPRRHGPRVGGAQGAPQRGHHRRHARHRPRPRAGVR